MDEYPEGQDYIGNYTVTEDVTFVAQWDASYTVIFDANGGHMNEWLDEEGCLQLPPQE